MYVSFKRGGGNTKMDKDSFGTLRLKNTGTIQPKLKLRILLLDYNNTHNSILLLKITYYLSVIRFEHVFSFEIAWIYCSYLFQLSTNWLRDFNEIVFHPGL